MFWVANAQANECDNDYLAHNQAVIDLTKSGHNELASAQRDCLAVELGKLEPGDDFCPTFRHFQREFLTLSEGNQIKKGQQCMKQLLDKRVQPALKVAP